MGSERFEVGQAVTVSEMGFGVRVSPAAQGEAGLTVVGVGPEHLTLDDAADGSRMSVPLYLIRKDAPAPAQGPEAA